MNPVLNQSLFFIKEHLGIFKAANSYDVLNPETQEVLLECREEGLGFFTKMFRFTKYKQMTPFDVTVKTPDGKSVLRVKRGISIFISTVEVFDENESLVGTFKQKFFSIGGKFDVLDSLGNKLCTLKGSLMSWDFKFSNGDVEYAMVNKKWAGFGKEMFTSADNYMLTIHETAPKNDPIRVLIMAAVVCIDMVLKE